MCSICTIYVDGEPFGMLHGLAKPDVLSPRSNIAYGVTDNYKGKGAHLGGSVLVSLSRFMGLHVQGTGHHFFTDFGSPNMLEGGLGLVFRIWR